MDLPELAGGIPIMRGRLGRLKRPFGFRQFRGAPPTDRLTDPGLAIADRRFAA